MWFTRVALIAQARHEFIHILEGLINAREAHIGDIIQKPKLFDHLLAHRSRRHFALGPREHPLGNAIHDLLHLREAHRALLARGLNSFENFFATKWLTPTVFLFDQRIDLEQRLKSREAPIALQTLAAAANGIALSTHSCVEDSILQMTAKWTLHSPLPDIPRIFGNLGENLPCVKKADPQPGQELTAAREKGNRALRHEFKHDKKVHYLRDSTLLIRGILMLRSIIFASSALILVGTWSIQSQAQTIEDGQGAIEITDPGTAEEAPPPARSTRSTFQPKVGRKAAEKYMGPKAAPAGAIYDSPSSSGSHYLALHAGALFSDTSYKWGSKDTDSNVGKYTVGLTYRVGEWVNSMDLGIRVDLNGYELTEGRATKLSFLPVVTFPDASSRFPLYFGAGVGAGVFINQVASESSLALDYQLFGGVRFFDVFQNTGFFLEAGLKNHIFLLSDGQFNGTYAALGTVFTF